MKKVIPLIFFLLGINIKILPQSNEIPVPRCSVPSNLLETVQDAKKRSNVDFDKIKNLGATVLFDWPIVQANGYSNPSFWGISNYIDHNLAYGSVQDYNCGTRTYDISGYNHTGTDIFPAPFSWKMMDNQEVNIVAVADGIIIYKADGNYDRNCDFSNPNWNAVYIRHADNSVTMYGHMKSGSLTSKAVGTNVIQGEYLGKIGSSGNSTGPHLHFEAYDSNNNTIDPWSGSCNPVSSKWISQKAYNDSGLLRVMTHSAMPTFSSSCGVTETTNEKTVFNVNETIYILGYFRTPRSGQTALMKVYDSNNTLITSFTFSLDDYDFLAYYSQNFTVPSNASSGKWRIETTYLNQINNIYFSVIGCTTPTAPITTSSSSCGTGTVTLSASDCAGTYNWYSASTGGTSLATTANYTTPSISTTTTYYVDCTVGTCSSTRSSATATINNQPSAPIVSPSFSRCGPGPITLSASGCSGTYTWYNGQAKQFVLGIGSSFTYNYTLSSYAWVTCTVGSCESVPIGVVATVNAVPVTPTVPSVTINNGQTATLTASNCSGTVNWFTQSTGGSSVFTGNPFTTPTLTATTSYYAECTSNNCTSTTRGSGTITVNQPTITLGTLASTNYCISNIISVPFTTTLPAGTTFTATLKKGTTIIQSVSGTSSPLSIFIPYNQSVVYGTDYTIQITSGTNSSTVSPNISIGDLWSASITDANNHDIYYTSSDYLCSGKTKIYYATVKDIWGNVISNGINYQWKKDGVEILGATTSTLTVSGSGTYSVLVTQASCSRSSNNVTLQSINSNTTTIVYGDAVACAGTSKRVESSYYSNTATYQWQRDGVTISGAVNRTYDATQSGLYKVITTDGTCTNTTSEQRLTFGTGLLASIGNGNDTTLCGTNSPYLYASNTYLNSSQYTYQWKKDGVNISGSGATNYYYNAPQAGVYSVTYTQGACSSTSRGITIVSSTLAQKPVITAGSITNICNGSIIINQNINGNYGYLYGTWYKDGVMVNSATNYQYVANTSGSYKMVYGSGACANESNTVTVNIGSTFTPKIYIPAYYGKTNLCGTGDYLYIYFDNQNLSGGVYTYQWQKDGVNIAGETNQYLYVTTAGNYTLSVSNGSCSGTSNGIAITNNTSVASITASENNIFCTNKTIRLDLKGANSYFTTPVVWKKDGATISGETSSFLYTNQAGAYTATYNQSGCGGTSSTFNLNIGYPSFITQYPTSINNGQTANLVVLGCIGTVNWYDVATGGTPIGTNAMFTTPPLNTSTSYYSNCSVNGCMNPNRAVIPIIVNCTNLYSLKTGNWNDISVWSCGRLPNSSDTVTISSGNTVTIPSGQTGLLYNLIQKGILVSNGLLKFGN